ncbi:MAG: Bug family tripartite tricarboxylate transporter substrate binding protein [Gemmatimonas sp.]
MIRAHALGASAVLAGLVLTLSVPASAQGSAEFYKGKSIDLYVGSDPGGEYDLLTRLGARHLGKHVPGNPNIVVHNMPGGGGIKMAIYLYNVPPKDGTTMGVILNNLPGLQATHDPNVPIDLTAMQWIGSISPAVETMTAFRTAGVTSWEEVKTKEVIAGATGRSSITYLYPTLMNAFLGTRFKIVAGYTSGNSINLAMEKGEVQARNNTWSSWKATKPDWLKDGTIKVLVQEGPKAPDLDVPRLSDLAKSDDDAQVIRLIVSGAYLGRPFATPPNVPPARVAALRAAFEAMTGDREFLEDAAKLKVDVAPIKGEELQAFVANLMRFPERLIPKAKEFLGE